MPNPLSERVLWHILVVLLFLTLLRLIHVLGLDLVGLLP